MHSVTEAAAILGLTDRYVRFLLKKGDLGGRKLGHDWVVLGLDYERKRRAKRRTGSRAAKATGQELGDVWTEGGL